MKRMKESQPSTWHTRPSAGLFTVCNRHSEGSSACTGQYTHGYYARKTLFLSNQNTTFSIDAHTLAFRCLASQGAVEEQNSSALQQNASAEQFEKLSIVSIRISNDPLPGFYRQIALVRARSSPRCPGRTGSSLSQVGCRGPAGRAARVVAGHSRVPARLNSSACPDPLPM